MSGSEELAQAEGEEMEGGEEVEGNEDDQELAAMQKELEKVEQQKAELDKLKCGRNEKAQARNLCHGGQRHEACREGAQQG